MKIKRRKKNDRTAFWFMAPLDYFKYRLAINAERRLDKTLPLATKQARDRARATRFRRDFKEGVAFRFCDKPESATMGAGPEDQPA